MILSLTILIKSVGATWYALHLETLQQLITLRKKCPCWELFWSLFSRMWTEYGEIRNIFLYSVRIRENADQSTGKSTGVTCLQVIVGTNISSSLNSYRNLKDLFQWIQQTLHVTRDNTVSMLVLCDCRSMALCKNAL